VVRKMLAAATLMLAVAVPGVVATASPAAAAGTPASTSSTASTTWYIAGTYATYEECNDAGYYGQATGQWISYYCEFTSTDYDSYYSLWVEVNYTPPPPCATPGHAYVVRNGQAYWSGYEGDERNGVPTLYLSRGNHVTVGGNGIDPGQQVFFYFYDDAGNYQGSATSHAAGSNCVANEREITINLYSGHYLVKAYYRSGNTGLTYFDRVTFLQVW
jgi:hypothetical protein